MSFGLKNDGATYQRAIQECLGEQISHNAEAYIDDVVVKTRDSATLIDDLKETFKNLCEWKWKLNLNKCVFGVPSRLLLGFLVSHRGIEASTKQIRDVVGPPRGLGGALVGPSGWPNYAQGLLPCPLAPYIHICHHFGQFLVYFLYTNNSPSTCGTR
jgi:hypothetical protein